MTVSRGVGRGGHNKKFFDDEKLLDQYVTKRIPVVGIAEENNVTPQSVYRRLKELRVTRTNSESHKGLQVGSENPNWKGGKNIDCAGYIAMRVNGKQTREHRVVVEENLGRKLTEEEVVHHKNGDRSDNKPENLEVFPSHSEHMKIHMTSEEARRKSLKAKGVKI